MLRENLESTSPMNTSSVLYVLLFVCNSKQQQQIHTSMSYQTTLFTTLYLTVQFFHGDQVQ